MNKIHNIFSRKNIHKKRKKELKKEKIIIDYREKNSLVASKLVKEGFEIEFRELKTGDYVVKDFVIERKTVSDFINSMINKRLLRQIENLKGYKNKLLIIEGIEEQEIYNDEKEGVNGDALRGFLLSITLKHKIPLILSKNQGDTARFIRVLAKKRNKEISLREKKKSENKKEQIRYILEAFPGIGPKTAKKLLGNFKNIQNIFNAPQEELKKAIGKKAEIFKLIEEDY